MTTGERIKEIRRTNNLSQEELGLMLGVSRQAISKWESDQSLPELEKLVVLCKKYNLSINYVLGIDELEGGACEETAKTPSSTAQDSVEDKLSGILNTYQKENKKRETFFKKVLIGCGCFLIVFTVALGIFVGKITNINANKSDFGYIIDNTAGSITNQTQTQIQNSLLESGEVLIKGANLINNTGTFSINLTPKTFEKDMEVYVVISSDGEKEKFKLVQDGNVFSLEVVLPLSNLMEFACTIVCGEKESTQILDVFNGLKSGAGKYLNVRNGECYNNGECYYNGECYNSNGYLCSNNHRGRHNSISNNNRSYCGR